MVDWGDLHDIVAIHLISAWNEWMDIVAILIFRK